MKTVEGYNVKIYTDNIEDSAIEQIKKLLVAVHRCVQQV